MTDKITKAMLSDWLKHPVTKGYLKIVMEQQEANKADLMDRLMNGDLKGQEEILMQLKGQILALTHVLNTKEFLEELTNEDGVNQ